MTTLNVKAEHPAGGLKATGGPITIAIVAIVNGSRRFYVAVLALAVLIAVGMGFYAATHFEIDTNTSDFISDTIPWRQRLDAVAKAFPQRTDQIVIVIDGKTAELAESASQRLADRLRTRADLFSSVERPDGGPYFNRNAFLFLPGKELGETVQNLQRARPFLGALAADESLRGLMDAFSYITRGVRSQAGTLDDFDKPIANLADAFASVLANKPTYFSWRSLFSGQPAESRELRRFVIAKPILDYAALEPGEVPTNFIRQSATDLGVTTDSGVRVRLTGPVPLADEEFATVAQGADINGIGTGLVVLLIIWLALKSGRIVLAVALTVVIGLLITAGVGIFWVGALNLISVAFAVLFVGIGVDFGIQFSVRYRAERHDEPTFDRALDMAARKVGRPLALAAVATTAGFYAFWPTAYLGVSQLGKIAGTGMIIAFLCSITILPALLTILRPPAEAEPVGWKFLAPVDRFLSTHRYLVIIGTLGVAFAGAPLLRDLHFDFNPMNLRSDKVESVSTLLDLEHDPNSQGTNTIDILEPSLAATAPVVARLDKLPEVAHSLTLNSLVPTDQDAKLPLIAQARANLDPVLDPGRARDAPSDADDVAAMRKAAESFKTTAGEAQGKGADDARRLAGAITELANADPAVRARARTALLPGLKVTIDLLRAALTAKPTGVDDIPAGIKRDWIAADGRARIEVAPKGDANDNATLARFTKAVQAVDPDATGEPVAIQESGVTIVNAFLEAALIAVVSISIILYIVLKRVTDVLLTLVPLLLAAMVTLEITVLIGMPLNFANIIALPLLLGLGVAFKIYFVMAWRSGVTNLLQSSLTRAVFFSAMTSATAFGSLWLSAHPGTSSMGKLLALSLVCTLCAAVLFQPALMGPPRVKQGDAPPV